MGSSTVARKARARLRAPARTPMGRSAVLLLCVFVLLTTKTGQGRAPAAPLNFFKNYFVTGDYRVYGVPIKGSPASGGFTTKDITIPLAERQRPNGCGAVAAYLYWSAVVAETNPGPASAGAQFDGNDISDHCQDPESNWHVTVLELRRRPLAAEPVKESRRCS